MYINQIKLNYFIAKYSENNPLVPNLRSIPKRNSDDYLISEEIRQIEIICIKLIGYDLNFLNCFDYLDFFLFIGIVEINEIENYKDENLNENHNHNHNNEENNLLINQEILEHINNQALKLITDFIMDLRCLEFPEIFIACSVIKLTRELNNFKKSWINLYKEIFLLEEEAFNECYECLKK